MRSGRSQGQSTASLPASNADRSSGGTVSRRRETGGPSPKPRHLNGARSVRRGSAADDIRGTKRLRQWFHETETAGYAFSFVLHGIALAICAVVLVEGMVGDHQFSTFLSETDQSAAVEFDDVLDTRIEMAESEHDTTNLPQLQRIESLDAQIPPHAFAERLQADVSTMVESGIGGGDGKLFAMPRGGNAVTKGSFTAWTVPEDPTPDRYYLIVIQIKLPARIETYRASDLRGLVRGTDRYEQLIPWDRRCPANSMVPGPDGQPIQLRRNGRLPVKDGVAQILIAVPPGEKLVRDTIQIKSRMLEEEQTLQIVF